MKMILVLFLAVIISPTAKANFEATCKQAGGEYHYETSAGEGKEFVYEFCTRPNKTDTWIPNHKEKLQTACKAQNKTDMTFDTIKTLAAQCTWTR